MAGMNILLRRFKDTPAKSEINKVDPHEECWWGAHLPYLGLEPAAG